MSRATATTTTTTKGNSRAAGGAPAMSKKGDWSKKSDFKFSAGPWNLHTGADPFGPPVRPDREFLDKLKIYKGFGFDYVQFHDDDAVPDDFSPAEREKRAKEVKKILDDQGLKAEFAAPR